MYSVDSLLGFGCTAAAKTNCLVVLDAIQVKLCISRPTGKPYAVKACALPSEAFKFPQCTANEKACNGQSFGSNRRLPDILLATWVDRLYARQVIKKKKLIGSVQGAIGGKSSELDMVAREIAVMKKMNHPNVVSLHEVIDDPASEALFIVMEYVSRGAVMSTEKLEGNEPLPLVTCRQYARDILSGLEYLHMNNVVSRHTIVLGPARSLRLARRWVRL